MSALIQFGFVVDMSGSVVTASAVSYTSAALPSAYMKIDVSRNTFFTGLGLAYQVTTLNGAVSSVTAINTTSINSSGIATAASGTFAWIGIPPANRNTIDVSFNFNNQGVWTQKVNFDAVSTVTSLGRHLTFVANSLLNGKQLISEATGPLSNTVNTTAAALNTNIGTAIRTALGTQTNLQTLLDTLIRTSGPFISTTAGSYWQAYDSRLSPISLLLSMISLTLSVSYYGTSRNLVIQNLPLLVNIA